MNDMGIVLKDKYEKKGQYDFIEKTISKKLAGSPSLGISLIEPQKKRTV